MESTSTTTVLAHFINVACIIWSKITSWARDVNSRDRDETLVRLETVSRPKRRDRDHTPSFRGCFHPSAEMPNILLSYRELPSLNFRLFISVLNDCGQRCAA